MTGFRRNLAAWYAENARELPWRRTHDPYAIWISEIMLQQTTVAAVIPYYERFLARFPTVADLARADEHDVLRLWEGLGYYSRARNLHATAVDLLARTGGEFPQTADELGQLKGIGRYTAGAIASFAFDQPAPIVEANTLRLYCRLIGYDGDPRSSAGQAVLWNFAETILPQRKAGLFNQALMELGATICLPRNPDCAHCPVQQYCDAYQTGRQELLPQPKAKPTITELTDAYLVVRNGKGEVLLRQRTAKERWVGLWDFPRGEIDPALVESLPVPPIEQKRSDLLPFDDPPSLELPESLAARLEEIGQQQTGLTFRIETLLGDLHHAVTRFRFRVVCFSAVLPGRHKRTPAKELRWVSLDHLTELPLTRPARRLASTLLA